MKRILVVMVMLALATGTVASPAVAANNSTSANATSLEGGPVAVDGVLTVTGWDYASGQMHVRLKAGQYKTVTLAASAEKSGKVAHAAYRRVTLQRGDTMVVSLPADRVDGSASVSITTGACIASGTCPTLYSDDNSGPLLTGGTLVGWLGGAIAAVVAAMLAAVILVKREQGAPQEV